MCLPLPLGANRDWIWPWFGIAIYALLALTMLALALRRWQPGAALLRSRWWLAAAALSLLAGLPHLGSVGWIDGVAPVDPAAAARALLLYGMCIALALLLLVACDSRRRLLWTAAVVFAAGVMQALWGAGMTLSGIEWNLFGHKSTNLGVATGTFVNRNHFAGYLAMCGALGLGLLIAQLSTRATTGWRDSARGLAAAVLGPRAWQRVALAAVVVGLVLSQSRMGNLSFFIALGCGAALALAVWRPLPRSLVWLFVSILLVDLLLIGSWIGVDRVAQRLAATSVAVPAGSGRDSDAERMVVASATLQLWREHRWLGVGPGGFRSVFPSIKPASVALFYDHAHNDWAQLLAERGVLGALPYLATLLLALHAAVLALQRRRDPRLRGIALGSAMGLLAFALHGLADFNAQIPANLATVHVLMALALSARYLPQHPPST